MVNHKKINWLSSASFSVVSPWQQNQGIPSYPSDKKCMMKENLSHCYCLMINSPFPIILALWPLFSIISR